MFFGEKENGKVEKLVSFNHKEENFQMPSCCRDYLVAVMLVDNILTFRAYNSQNGYYWQNLQFGIKTVEAASDFIRYTPYVNVIPLFAYYNAISEYRIALLNRIISVSYQLKISNGSGADIKMTVKVAGASGGIDADDGDTNTMIVLIGADGHTDADGSKLRANID